MPSHFYQFYRPGLSRHYDITTAEDRQEYYAEISYYTPSKPNITLRAGTSKTSPTVAVSKFARVSRNFMIGLGDPSTNPRTIQWENMHNDSLWYVRCRWKLTLPLFDGERCGFTWKHTRNIAVGGKLLSSWSVYSCNHKLVDAQDHIVAVFTGGRLLDKCGALQINVDYGEEFDTMAIMTILSMYEKMADQSSAGATAAVGGAAGAGGGG